MTDVSTTRPDGQPLTQLLRQALSHLYDPSFLRHCGLARRLETILPADSIPLREQIVAAIESLRPTDDQPANTKSRRYYQILTARYVQGFTQRDVANDLGLSIRHLRREQAEAIALLAESLNEAWGLVGTASRSAPNETPPESSTETDMSLGEALTTLDMEVERLGGSLGGDVADLGAQARDALGVVGPMLTLHDVELDPDELDTAGDASVAVPGTVLKQALLTLLSTAIHCAHGGRMLASLSSDKAVVSLGIRAMAASGECEPLDSESLDAAQRLLVPFGGTVRAEMSETAFEITVTLPASRHYHVLAIEDNTDSLGLWTRYLQGTQYLLSAVSDPNRALAAAQVEQPDVILLDVMMPGIDGWDLLAQLRNHPATAATPVIICTVLPQRELALSLGARDFVRKPATRQEFVETIGRVVRG